jgi:hypothetical protein
VLIILFQNEFESFELSMTDSFEHVFAIRCIVEETSTLSSTTLLFETHDIAHDHGAYQVFRPDTFQVLVTSDSI